MIVIEEEAKMKRCCGPEGCGDWRFEDDRTVNRAHHWCVGSACMAWRWAEAGTLMFPDGTLFVGKTMGEMESARSKGARVPGYCGLAGNQT